MTRVCEEIMAKTPPYLVKSISPQFQMFNKLPAQGKLQKLYHTELLKSSLKEEVSKKIKSN